MHIPETYGPSFSFNTIILTSLYNNTIEVASLITPCTNWAQGTAVSLLNISRETQKAAHSFF